MKKIKDIKSKIRSIPDWPIRGVIFRDMTPLIRDQKVFSFVIDQFIKRYRNYDFDVVASIESRGYIIGSVLANKLNLGFIPLRKKIEKIPGEIIHEEYDLEYGKDKIGMSVDAIRKGDKVLLADDLIATGGTALAACKLIERLGGQIVECCFIIDLPDLGGKNRLKNSGYKVYNQVEFEGE